MKRETAAILSERLDEVALWCSFQGLTEFRQDSPEQARRWSLLKEATQLLVRPRRKYAPLSILPDSWPDAIPPDALTLAMTLMKKFDPESLLLRSTELKPADAIGNTYDSLGSSYSEELRREIVEGVLDLRSSLIKTQLAGQGPHRDDQYRGRLLLYVPRENVADGASQSVSAGFFDAYDCPPWDLWVRYSDGTLLSWVPELLFPLVEAGIAANPVDCVRWFD